MQQDKETIKSTIKVIKKGLSISKDQIKLKQKNDEKFSLKISNMSQQNLDQLMALLSQDLNDTQPTVCTCNSCALNPLLNQYVQMSLDYQRVLDQNPIKKSHSATRKKAARSAREPLQTKLKIMKASLMLKLKEYPDVFPEINTEKKLLQFIKKTNHLSYINNFNSIIHVPLPLMCVRAFPNGAQSNQIPH